MILQRLFTPKWKHKNPNVRMHALLALRGDVKDDQAIYATVAREDEEGSVRRLAVQRLNDVSLLGVISANDSDRKVCADAEKRLCILLSGKSKGSPDYETRKAIISDINDEKILKYLLKHATDSEIRLSIAKRMDQQSIYAELAVNDPDRELKLTAIKMIVQQSLLERVVKQTRRKDKSISQAAQIRLDAMRAESERGQQFRQEAKLLCAEINALVNTARENTSWDDLQVEFDNTTTKWQELVKAWRVSSDQVDATFAETFERASIAFNDEKKDFQEGQAQRQALNEQYAPVQKAKSDLCDRLETVKSNINQQDIPTEADVAKLQNLQDSSRQEWREISKNVISPLDQYDEALDRALNERFENLQISLKDYAVDIGIFLKSAKIAQGLAANLNRLVSGSKPIKSQDINKFADKWAKLPKLKYFQLTNNSATNLDTLLAKLQSKFDKQEKQRKQDNIDFQALVVNLSATLSDGKAAQANKLLKQGQKLLRNLPPPDVQVFRDKGILQQFQNAQDQVNNLQDWRQWSNEPKKLKLCESVEQLVTDYAQEEDKTQINHDEIAEQVRLAREQWKKLSKAEVNASNELWQRFDTACSQAYAPCQEYYDQQVQERDMNLAQRQTTCADLEKYTATVASKPFEQVDWRAVDKIIRVAQQDWQKLGPVNRKDKSDINQRFRTALNNLSDLNRENKQQNADEKVAIIKSAERIATSLLDERIPLNEAIDGIKALQAKWKTVGIAIKDGELWKNFRKPCDEVFNVRKSKVDEQNQERQQIIDTRVQLITNIDACAELNGEELMRARSEIESARQQWAELERLPKNDTLEKRFAKAQKKFHQQVQNFQAQALQALRKQQQDMTAQCWAIEELIRNTLQHNITNEESAIAFDAIQQQWAKFKTAQDKLSKIVEQRFKNDVQLMQRVVSDDAPALSAELEKNTEFSRRHKQQLCLQLEILRDVESPDEFQQARMEYQVSQLAEKMKQDPDSNIDAEMENLLMQWHSAGLVFDDNGNQLETRFFDALNDE